MMIVLLAHTAATLVMVGVIWFVQVVHYPLCGIRIHISIQTEVLPQDQRRMVLEQAILLPLQGGKMSVQVLRMKASVAGQRYHHWLVAAVQDM
jgi:hypothetical protein